MTSALDIGTVIAAQSFAGERTTRRRSTECDSSQPSTAERWLNKFLDFTNVVGTIRRQVGMRAIAVYGPLRQMLPITRMFWVTHLIYLLH
jgi:hypothetical protein